MKKTFLFWTLLLSAIAILTSCGGGGGGGGSTNNSNDITPDTNQLTWTKASAHVPAGAWGGGHYRSTACGNSVWVAIGDDFTSWSTDAANWTSSMFTPPPYTLGHVTFGNNLFVALGGSYFLKSTDGKTWTSQNFVWNNQTGSGSQGAQSLADITYGNGKYVAVDNRFLTNDVIMVFTSTNGSSWSQHTASNTYAQPTAITYGNGMYVIVGYGGLVLTSTDGATWMSRNPGASAGLMGVAYGNNIFVAVSNQGGKIYTSPDGITWTASTAGPNGFTAVAFGNGLFVAVGNAITTGQIYTSTDGKTWTKQTGALPGELEAVAYGNGRFVAVGADGNIEISQKSTASSAFTVTYNGNGNTGGSVPGDSTNYLQGQTVTVLGNTGSLVKNGYSFVGWNTQANGSGTTYTQAQTFTIGAADVTLYAKWTASPTYTITYNDNGAAGGSVPNDSTNYLLGQTVTALGNTGGLVKTGYSFSGWNTLANGSGTTYTQAQTFTMGAANVTLYAMWTANPTYTVTYNGNGNTGGSVPIDSYNYLQEQTVSVRWNEGSLVKTGYSFSGWNTQANGTGTTYTPWQTFTMGAGNVTLYAKWNATYTVTYDSNGSTGGSAPVDSTAYVQGQTVTVLGDTGSLLKTGYSFLGWNTQANGSGTTYTQAQTFTMGTANVTLYALWIESTYTVTYNGNGATGGSVPIDSTIYLQGQTVTALGNTGSLVKTGYSFSGWNTWANGFGTPYTPAQTFTMGTASVTLYAKWTANSPGAAFAYMASGGNTVSQYTIGANGALTPMTPATVAAGTGSQSIAADPSGKFAYTANWKSNNLSLYSIGANGALTPMTPATLSAGLSPWSVTVHPSGKYAYVVNESENTVSQYTIGADGMLTPMTTAKVGAGGSPWVITVDPSGKYAYIANYSGSVSQYTIGASGELTSMSPATVAAGTGSHSVTVDPSGRYAYVANYSNNVSQYTIGPSGKLTPMSPATVAAGISPWSVAVDPSGKYAYTADGGGTVSQYTIGANGALTPMTPATVAVGLSPTFVTIDPSGKYVYVANAGYPCIISQYTIGADGALTPMSPATVAAETGSSSIVIVVK